MMSKTEKRIATAASPTTTEKHGYEFGGPLGALVVTVGLPIVVYLSIFLCNDVSGCPAPSLLHPSTLTVDKLKREIPWPENGFAGLFDLKIFGYVLGYYGLSLALQLLLPGTETEGVKLRSGGRLKYKFNAFPSAMVILGAAAVGTALQGPTFPLWTITWEKLPQIVTANMIVATVLAVFVYVRSFSVPPPGSPNPRHRELALGGQTGNMVYDFFIGRELNPRLDIPKSLLLIGGQTIDIKAFMELRPGLLGWILMDLSALAHQYAAYGYVSDSILLVTVFQTLYTLDAMYMEPAILTTIDITTDGFGYMLSFGDVVWVPFIYSLQARYLAVYPVHLGLLGIAGVLAVQGLGYMIFRGANNEKNMFRTNPQDPKIKHLQYMETKSGSKLLISGWWGTARHINYLGDWIMGWSYCLPTGIPGYVINTRNSPATGVTREVVQGEARGWGVIATYFYILYFAILLIHREARDEEKCKKKYGADWDIYTKKVRSRILPGVY